MPGPPGLVDQSLREWPGARGAVRDENRWSWGIRFHGSVGKFGENHMKIGDKCWIYGIEERIFMG